MARRGSFSATFNGVRYLLLALGVLILIGTKAEASSDVRAFAWMCVVIGFPAPLLVLTFRFVAWLLRLFGICKLKRNAQRPPQPQTQRKQSPYTMRDGEVALAFRVGNRYYDAVKNRVFECIALKGKKARIVAFSLLDSVEWEKEQMAKYHDTGDFHKVRTDGGVETCQRGALRADRQATDKEVAAEFEVLRQLRKRESA